MDGWGLVSKACYVDVFVDELPEMGNLEYDVIMDGVNQFCS